MSIVVINWFFILMVELLVLKLRLVIGLGVKGIEFIGKGVGVIFWAIVLVEFCLVMGFRVIKVKVL